MDTYVSRLLNDEGSVKWTSSAHRLPALNTAQNDFVLKVLSYGQEPRILDILTEIQDEAVLSIETTGYALSELAGPMVHGGVIGLKCLLDKKYVWATRIPSRNLPQQTNRYRKGSDTSPQFYIIKNVLYVTVGDGSYPVSSTLYYVREPKELVTAGPAEYQTAVCEINSMYHEFICKMATAECHRMHGDTVNLNRYGAIMQEVESQIQRIAVGGASESMNTNKEAWEDVKRGQGTPSR